MNHRPNLSALGIGIVSATGFVPLGLWPMTLVCFATLMLLVRGAPTVKAAALRGWLFGVGHFTVGLNWIAHAFDYQDAMPHWLGYVAVMLLALYLAAYPGLAAGTAFALRRTRRGGEENKNSVAFFLIFAATWTTTEYLRATLFTGFAWNSLGVIFVPAGVLPMAATVVGTYGLSAIAILIAGGLALAWDHAWLRALAVLIPAMVLALIPKPSSDASRGPLLRIVQPNTSQAERHDSAYDEVSVRALERLTGPPGREARLILWPEAASPYFLEDERWARDRFAQLMGPADLLLTGGDALIYDKKGDLIAARNSLFAIAPDANIVARYDKAHLVPYGEYLPMRPLLSAIGLSRLVPGDLDFIPGPGPQTEKLPGFGKAGIQICYEIVFSGQVVDRAHRPDFIFNPSTDAWFGRWGPPQHLAQARLRAIEEGLPVIRATPTGISAVVDANGRLLASLPLNKAGFIATRLPAAARPTPFAHYGNILSLAFAFFLGLAGVALGRPGR